MLFSKKKKPKIDPKVRFQNKQFTTKLDSARSYKRSTKSVPEAKWERTLQALGLTSRWSQAALLVLVVALLYLAYVPNFLTLKSINISGLSASQQQELDEAIRKKIADAPFYDPQYNLFFLKEELIRQAAAEVPSIDYINDIRHVYVSQSLVIDAASKYERFLLATPEQVYDVYNDGTLKAPAGIALTDWEAHQNASMTHVRLHQIFDFQPNRAVFTPELFGYIKAWTDSKGVLEGHQAAYLTFREPELPKPQQVEATNALAEPMAETEAEESSENPEEALIAQAEPVMEIKKIELPLSSSELHVVFYKHNDVRRTYKVIFDATGDARKSLEELKLLLSQTAPDRYDQLYYIDLRIPDKAFICLESAPCRQ